MLCLSRELDQQIRIGKAGEIVIKVLEIRRGKVVLGVVAPPDEPIDREEIFQRKLAEQAA